MMPEKLTLAGLPIRPEGETFPALTHTAVICVHKVLFTPVASVSTVINFCRIYLSRNKLFIFHGRTS